MKYKTDMDQFDQMSVEELRPILREALKERENTQIKHEIACDTIEGLKHDRDMWQREYYKARTERDEATALNKTTLDQRIRFARGRDAALKERATVITALLDLADELPCVCPDAPGHHWRECPLVRHAALLEALRKGES